MVWGQHLICCGVSVYPPRTHPGLTLGGTLFVRLMSCAKPFLPISERQSLRYNTTDTTIQRYLGLWLRSSVCCPRNMIDSSRLKQATSSEIFCELHPTNQWNTSRQSLHSNTTDTTIQTISWRHSVFRPRIVEDSSKAGEASDLFRDFLFVFVNICSTSFASSCSRTSL